LRRQGLDFSFSGLKTAVRLAVEAHRSAAGELPQDLRADIAASFQAAVVETLVDKCRAGLEATGLERIVIAGGVGANQSLRAELAELGRTCGFQVKYPRPALCTDNGAMIAYAGAQRAHRELGKPARIVARPRWSLEELTPP
jgi:N6-L-threonylcarbamoyladenine synthase